ncbi:ribosomal protein L7/L12 [Corallococcus sp. M7]
MLKRQGKVAEEVVLEAEANGMDRISIIRMVRALFGLSLREAKEVLARAAGFPGGARERQEQFLEPLMQALAEEDTDD